MKSEIGEGISTAVEPRVCVCVCVCKLQARVRGSVCVGHACADGHVTGASLAAAVLQESGQTVSQLGQLEDLPVQQLQQRAQTLPEALALPPAALQTLLHVRQTRLQLRVPRLRLLREETASEASAPRDRRTSRSRYSPAASAPASLSASAAGWRSRLPPSASPVPVGQKRTQHLEVCV